MANLSLKNIVKKYYNGFIAVQGINLDISDKEFLVLVGPSGSGKSTILRLIAGLEDITEGELYIDNCLMNDVNRKERDIAMVSQNYALYPHMTAYENMEYELKNRGISEIEIKKIINDTATIMGIENLLECKPKELSGGQRQLVSIGCAIVCRPKVFLMDEPLSNLDAKLREQIKAVISKVYQRLQTTFIYVTHEQSEAMTLGTKVAVMKEGRIHQIDTPQNLYYHPKDIFVAEFIGTPQMNFINVDVAKTNKGIHMNFGEYSIKIPKNIESELEKDGYIGKEIIIGIRPEDIYIDKKTLSKKTINVNVDYTEFLGHEVLVHFKIGKNNMVARINPNSTIKANDKIKISLNINKVHYFDKETQKTIIGLDKKETKIKENTKSSLINKYKVTNIPTIVNNKSEKILNSKDENER